VIMFALFAKLSSSTLLRSAQKLRQSNPAHQALVSMATATASEESEDGIQSAEAAIKEAEKEASQQEATAETSEGTDDSTEQTTLSHPQAPNAAKVVAIQPDKADKATSITAAIQTIKPWMSKNASRALAKKSVCGPRTIRLTIKGAAGLRGEDAKARGVTDPYCVCEVQGKPKTRVQSMALDGFHGVHWDHDGEIADFLAHEAITCSIYDQDALADDPDYFLGRTTLAGKQLLTQGFKGELNLTDGGVHSAVLKLEVMPLPLDVEAEAVDIQEMVKAGCEDKSSEIETDDDDDADDDDSEHND